MLPLHRHVSVMILSILQLNLLRVFIDDAFKNNLNNIMIKIFIIYLAYVIHVYYRVTNNTNKYISYIWWLFRILCYLLVYVHAFINAQIWGGGGGAMVFFGENKLCRRFWWKFVFCLWHGQKKIFCTAKRKKYFDSTAAPLSVKWMFPYCKI